MKRVVLLWIAAFILIPQGIAQIREESPYKRSDLQNDFFKQKRFDRTHLERFKGERQEESTRHLKTIVRPSASEIFVHQKAISPFNGEIVDIPDTAFLYALIDEGVDTDMDSLISFNEADSVTVLAVNNRGISDMTGIEAFVMLDSLNCAMNNIDILDLSTLSELIYLSCSGNPIDSLDLSNNPNLQYLWVDGCDLTALDLSNNPGLLHLYAWESNLTYLDLTNNPLLERLYCDYNQLSSLDVSANVNLETLWCEYNNLKSLDVSKNLNLTLLICNDNDIDTLDVSNNESLEAMNCGFNNLTSLILPDDCALWILYCYGNSLESLDVTGCTLLEDIRCLFNEITSLDLSNNPLLNVLSCENNRLSSLDVSNNLELNAIWCGENLLTTLDLSNNNKIGRYPFEYVHLNVEYMPSLGEVCVWDSFPGDATIGYDGSPNLCFENGEECDGVCEVPLSGIEGFDESALSIYPNPTSDLLSIETATYGPHSIRIHALNGQEIHNTTFTGSLHQIDLSLFSKGIYFLSVQSEDYTITRKVVKL